MPAKTLISILLLSSFVLGCKEPSKKFNGATQEDLENIYTFVPQDPVREEALVRCVKADSAAGSCRLNDLPLLGMETTNPDISQIMERLVVSHNWMGQRFQQILEGLPEEILPLFESLTAVVIDDDIRPSYYTSLTGAIYLDAASLWLTEEERLTVTEKEDFRAAFSDPLPFRALSSYSLGNSRQGLFDRDLQGITNRMARLILHELAHAADFFPPKEIAQLNPERRIVNAVAVDDNKIISDELAELYPLLSTTMTEAAAVMYRGKEPSAFVLGLSAEDLGASFELDGAAHPYSYSSRAEDLAMLFENVLMNYFYGFDHDNTFTDAPSPPAGEQTNCSHFILAWGERNSFASDEAKPRAEYVLEQILPDLDLSEFISQLPRPQKLRAGQNWCEDFLVEPDQAPLIFN